MDKNVTEILSELFKTIEILGINGTIETLKDAKNKKQLVDDIDIDFVLDAVSQTTGLNKDRILYGNDRSDERKIALCLSVYFIKNNFHYSYSEIKKIFKKDSSVLSRYNSYVKNLPKNPKTNFDKTIDKFCKEINYLINKRNLKN